MQSVKLKGAISTDQQRPFVTRRADFTNFMERAARKQGGVLGAGSAPGIAALILGLGPSLSVNDGLMFFFAPAIPSQEATDRSGLEEDTVESNAQPSP
jgi:hypothetical protein